MPHYFPTTNDSILRCDSWSYNLAFYYFQQQEYKKSMPLLLQVEFKDILYNLDARRMLLKSYFELEEYTALDSHLDAFTRYLRRQKDIGYHRENYLNLIRFTRKIMQTGAWDRQGRQKIKKNMEATKELAEREWLLEKVKES